MSITEARKARQQKKQQEIENSKKTGDFWFDLCNRIKTGEVIPIISNSVRNNRIFDADGDANVDTAPAPNQDDYTVEEEIAEAWAEELEFPLPEKHKLPQVALYNRTISPDDKSAKTRYLTFLKDFLLDVAEHDQGVAQGLISEQRDNLNETSFTDIAKTLGYPRLLTNKTDPLITLANLKLPIYVTTSFYGFLEQAIVEASDGNIKPRTQVCFWSGEPEFGIGDEEFRVDPDFKPTPEEPLVYHLFGYEKYPQSLVLSEDDYLDFLVKVTQPSNQHKQIVPLYLWKALTQSSLLLLGYRLQDWDFRVLFRGILNAKHTVKRDRDHRDFSLAIQLNPKDKRGFEERDEVKDFLQKYLKSSEFDTSWQENDEFIENLWQEWQKFRGVA